MNTGNGSIYNGQLVKEQRKSQQRKGCLHKIIYYSQSNKGWNSVSFQKIEMLWKRVNRRQIEESKVHCSEQKDRIYKIQDRKQKIQDRKIERQKDRRIEGQKDRKI